ncbi:MAG: hypothetical protein IH822_01785 [Chloroflexi bacterium]|nr:hypothetical protein [Chloroflexota bacterium]
MTSLTTDQANERVRVIQESANFTEAAARLNMPITTLKTWARRNPKYVSKELYESKLQLTPEELIARKQSLPKAVEAARGKPRRYSARTRPGPVTVTLWKPTSPQQFADAFLDRMMALRAEVGVQAERIAALENETNRLKYEQTQLEAYRTVSRRQKEEGNAAFKKRLTDAMGTGEQ